MNQPSLTIQIFSTIGAFCCLFAYVGHQLKWMDPRKIFYNLLNIIGAGILTYIAFKPFQSGFFLMEGIWTVMSVYALFRVFCTKVLNND